MFLEIFIIINMKSYWNTHQSKTNQYIIYLFCFALLKDNGLL